MGATALAMLFVRTSRGWCWFESSAAIVWLGFALAAGSNVSTDLFHFIAAVYAALWLAALWVVHGVLVAASRTKHRQPLVTSPFHAVWAFVLPGCGALALVLLAMDIPFQVRFAMSEDALEAHAREALASGHAEGGWVGLFQVSDASVRNGCVNMPTGQAFIDRVGIAWCEDAPVDSGSNTYRHLHGHFWRYIWRF